MRESTESAIAEQKMTKEQLIHFWDRVNIAAENDCWEWTACKWNGYGNLRVNGKKQSAHRTSWRIENGAIPDGLCVLHHCDNRACVNPNHLFLGSRADNVADMDKKGRRGTANHKGEANPSSILTEEQVLCIMEELNGGNKTQTQIARDYGVSRGAIYAIAYKKSWIWLNGR